MGKADDILDSVAEKPDSQAALRERRLRAELESVKGRYRQALVDLEHAESRGYVLDELAAVKQRDHWSGLTTKVRGANSAVLILSDWHLGETVDPSTVNGVNEFNMGIARRRVERVFKWSARIIETQNKWLPVKEVVVGLIGDVVTGYIHEELLESCDASPTESLLVAKELIVEGIEFLLRELKQPIRVVTAFGNHGRTTQRMRFSTGYKNSYEWLLYRDLAYTFRKEKRVAWQVGNGRLHWADIQGHACRFHHGDDIRYQGGVGGITIPVNKKLAQWNKQRWATMDFFGHYHQFCPTPRWLCNASLIGTNAYSIAIGAEPEPPSQSLVWMNRERGNVLALRVFCEEPELRRVA